MGGAWCLLSTVSVCVQEGEDRLPLSYQPENLEAYFKKRPQAVQKRLLQVRTLVLVEGGGRGSRILLASLIWRGLRCWIWRPGSCCPQIFGTSSQFLSKVAIDVAQNKVGRFMTDLAGRLTPLLVPIWS